jgi:DNA-binding NarL/FixJ family response regulator
MTGLPNTKPISVIVADADLMLGSLLANFLNRHPDFNVSANVVNCELLLRAVQAVKSNVALISTDLEDGPLSGLAVLPRVRDLDPHLRVVVLLSRSRPDLVVEALRSGARGVFSRAQFEPATLFRCVHRVHEGQIWVNTDEMEFVLRALSQKHQLRLLDSQGSKLLSHREMDVVRLVAEGLSNREIAQELKLSEHTVKNYLLHIFDKLGISNRVELVLYAMTNRAKIPPASERKIEIPGAIEGSLGLRERGPQRFET